MKNLKMKTKLILGFLVPVVLTIVNMYLNKLAMATALKIKDPVKEASYERNAEIFTTSITVIAIIITVFVALALIKAIEKSVKQLSDAADEIAMGHINVEMVKYNNDEFG